MPRALRSDLACALACALALAAACGPAPAKGPNAPNAPLDTVDVTAKPDAQANLATDVVAAPHPDASGFAGALPPDFPKDVPLPEPSSLVDFGAHGVTVEVQAGVAAAKAAYVARLKANGFAPTADGSWRKGARQLGVTFADASGATRIAIEIH
jgi:hypothetical protein